MNPAIWTLIKSIIFIFSLAAVFVLCLFSYKLMGKKKIIKQTKLSDSNLLLLITVCVFLVMYAYAVVFLGKGFRKPQQFFNLLNENAALIILSCGMSLVMITGGIDISVGTMTALVCMSCAVNLDRQGGNIGTALLITLGIGLSFGMVQGFLVAYLDIQPFIVTLAGMFFAKGMTTIVNATQFNVENQAFKALKATRITVPFMGSVNKLGNYVPAYVEIGVIVAIVCVVLLFITLKWTKMGRGFYAVGGNIQSANMLGINVKLTKFHSHVICSLLAAIGSWVYFMHVGSGSPSHASVAEMNAIASSIIGGTLLSGGVGNILGTFFGVLSLSTIKNIVSSLGLDEAWWTNITVALMICVFLLVQSLVLARKNKDSV